MSEETHTHKFTPTLSFRSWGLQGDMSTSQTDIHAQTETWQRDLSTSLQCQMCQERPVYPSTEEIRLETIYLQVNTEIICQCNFLWVAIHSCGRSACVIPLLRRLGVWRGRQKRLVRWLSGFLGGSDVKLTSETAISDDVHDMQLVHTSGTKTEKVTTTKLWLLFNALCTISPYAPDCFCSIWHASLA